MLGPGAGTDAILTEVMVALTVIIMVLLDAVNEVGQGTLVVNTHLIESPLFKVAGV
jgi:hypothetical protein